SEHLSLRYVSADSGSYQSGGGGAQMSTITNVSRRSVLKGLIGAGALVLGARYVPKALLDHSSLSDRTEADLGTLHPNVFLGIDTDGTGHVVASRSEMGTFIRTSLPLVFADELDADW